MLILIIIVNNIININIINNANNIATDFIILIDFIINYMALFFDIINCILNWNSNNVFIIIFRDFLIIYKFSNRFYYSLIDLIISNVVILFLASLKIFTFSISLFA